MALLSKAGSSEEAATLKKTEKMAHAAALGLANGATDALKFEMVDSVKSSKDSGSQSTRKDSAATFPSRS